MGARVTKKTKTKKAAVRVRTVKTTRQVIVLEIDSPMTKRELQRRARSVQFADDAGNVFFACGLIDRLKIETIRDAST